MKRTLFITAFIMLVLALSACGGASVKVDQGGNGQVYDMKTGQSLSISLEGNPTTGFNWEVIEIDPAVLEQVGEPEFKADSKLIGAGGVITLKFKALTPGKSTIKLFYHKSWEKHVPPEKEFEITVNVK